MTAGEITSLVIALLGLVFSGFVSGSEIAYFSLTRHMLDEADETDGPERNAPVRKLLRQPERLLATILIANNMVNITIVVLTNYALGPIFSGLGAVLSFVLQSVILTFLILLFGEIMPKLAAQTHPLAWARVTTRSWRFLMTLLRPFSALLVRSSSIVHRVVVKKPQNISADELSQALELTDVEKRDDSRLLQEILRFGDTTASEVMTPRVDITDISIDSTFDEVMQVVLESGYARIPVYETTQDNIRGILYARDLLPYVEQRAASFRWQSLLRDAYFVPESRMIDDLLEDFRRRKVHMAIVVDEFGGTQGIVTLEDVLEEIVGDIDDEYDEEEKNYRRLPDDTFIFEGKTLLNDFFRITEQEDVAEELYGPVMEDCETLAGMLLAIKGDFPREKESLVYGRCRFLVLDISAHRIASVRVKVFPEVQQ
ncbi:MAG: gliding motility-associated protein GldE [Bacteroides sp.]|nr:gliding motility-associated protein GldE [Bacteroides sp.]MCM1380080.1 gliding motility-associated protein GldE [Bacteroides sp.]MCM1446417.1 gliding motility-associated protein GldE [Prevotella sp.]